MGSGKLTRVHQEGTTPLRSAKGWHLMSGIPWPSPLALRGIREDVFHVVNLAAEVFALYVLLFLELAEHHLLLP